MAATTAEAKEEVEDPMEALNQSMQFPTRRKSMSSSAEPVPISAEFPKINPPNEALLPINQSDWNMYCKVHAKFGDKLKVLYPDDTTRFIQGYASEKERERVTMTHVAHLLDVHEDYGFDSILDKPMENDTEQKCLKVWPVFMYGYDDEGHPVVYDEFANTNPADLDATVNELGLRVIKMFRYRFYRRLHNVKRIQNMRYGLDASINQHGGVNSITKHVLVTDIGGVYSRMLTAHYRNLVNDISGDDADLWPNTMQSMYIIKAPWTFRAAWKMIKMFLHPVTAAKVNIVGKDYLKYMTKHIALDQIPKSYGGTGTLPVRYAYSADIDPDLLDGDYASQPDPIDLDTIPCVKNREKLKSKEVKKDQSESAVSEGAAECKEDIPANSFYE